MCYNAQASFVSFCVLTVSAGLLVCFGGSFGPYLAPFVFALGMIQLVEGLIHSKTTSSETGGKLLFVVLWLQCFLLAGGVALFVNNRSGFSHVGWALAGIFGAVALYALYYAATNSGFSGAPGESGHLEWSKDGGDLLGGFGWLYLLGLALPMVLLFVYFVGSSVCKAAGVALLTVYGVASFWFVRAHYPEKAFSSMWCYLSVIFGFLVLGVSVM